MADVEAPHTDDPLAFDVPVTKTWAQMLRDAVLFGLSLGIGFGPFWYGIYMLPAWNSDGHEGLFFARALVSAFVSAVVLVLFFSYVLLLAKRCGGRVVYKMTEGTSRRKKWATNFMIYEFGGIFFLGGVEATFATFHVTDNKFLHVTWVSCSYALGFFLWYLYKEIPRNYLPWMKAVREDKVELPKMKAVLLDVIHHTLVLLIVAYTSRATELFLRGGPSAFVANIWFVLIWFELEKIFIFCNGE
jgi:hypothetical protein